MIYALQIQDFKYVKIGFSANEDVLERIAALQTGNPYQLMPVLTTFGTIRQEQALHHALNKGFGRIRIPIPPNEWYPGKNPWFQRFLEMLKYGPDAALLFLDGYDPAVKQPGQKKGGQYEAVFRWP